MLSSQQFLIYNLLDIKHLILALSLGDYSRESIIYSTQYSNWGLGTQNTITNKEVFENLDYIVLPNPTDLPR
jgi:hypothetical protein